MKYTIILVLLFGILTTHWSISSGFTYDHPISVKWISKASLKNQRLQKEEKVRKLIAKQIEQEKDEQFLKWLNARFVSSFLKDFWTTRY